MHLGDLRSDAVVLDERLAALHARLRPFDRTFIDSRRRSNHGRGRIGIRGRKEINEHLKTLADLTDDVLVRHEAVLKVQLGVIGKPLTHLVVHAANREAVETMIEQEARRTVGERFTLLGLCEQQINVRTVAVGDEMLHAVDAPAAIDLLGFRLERRFVLHEIIRRRLRLRDADREQAARRVAE